MHLIKPNSWEVSHCYMFRHSFAIFRELENKGNFMPVNLMYFRISIILVRAIWEVCHPRCVCETWKIVCSQTQLCHMRCI